jgi:acyl-coenzyme A thioesterase PaaI-like protein
VTIAFSASYLAGAAPDQPLRASGTFIRRTRHLAFATAELRSEGRLLALATVTKAVRSSA